MSGPIPFLALQNGSKMNTAFQRAEKPKLRESTADLQEVCGSQEFLTLGVDSHPNRGWWGLGKHFLVRTFRFLLLSSLVSSVCRPNHYKTSPWRKSKSSAVEVAESSLMSENGPADWKQYSHPNAPLTPQCVTMFQALNRRDGYTSTDVEGVSEITAQFRSPPGPFPTTPM